MTLPLSKQTRRARTRVHALLVAVAILLAGATVFADNPISVLSERLKNGSDSRVKVQAALALGASNDEAAVAPLCEALDDTTTAVRSAAASALGRLRMRSALPCLKTKGGAESNESVKTQLERAVRQIETGDGDPGLAARPPNEGSKYYVAFGVTKVTGQRSVPDTDPIVQASMREALGSKPTFAFAPMNETIAQGTALVNRHRLRGYFLQATVEEPVYEGGKLTVTVKVTMYSYPGKALQGDFAPKLTQSGTPAKDKASEDALIKMAIGRAMSRFIAVAEAAN